MKKLIVNNEEISYSLIIKQYILYIFYITYKFLSYLTSLTS